MAEDRVGISWVYLITASAWLAVFFILKHHIHSVSGKMVSNPTIGMSNVVFPVTLKTCNRRGRFRITNIQSKTFKMRQNINYTKKCGRRERFWGKSDPLERLKIRPLEHCLARKGCLLLHGSRYWGTDFD